MNRGIILFMVNFLVCFNSYSQAQSDSSEIKNIEGRWTAVRFTTGEVLGLTKGEIDSCLGGSLVIEKTFISLFGDTCFNPEVRIQKEPAQYLQKELEGFDTSGFIFPNDSGYSFHFNGKQIHRHFNKYIMFFPNKQLDFFANKLLLNQDGVEFLFERADSLTNYFFNKGIVFSCVRATNVFDSATLKRGFGCYVNIFSIQPNMLLSLKKSLSYDAWIKLLKDTNTDWATDLVLHFEYKRNDNFFYYKNTREEWVGRKQKEDIEYWETYLKNPKSEK